MKWWETNFGQLEPESLKGILGEVGGLGIQICSRDKQSDAVGVTKVRLHISDQKLKVVQRSRTHPRWSQILYLYPLFESWLRRAEEDKARCTAAALSAAKYGGVDTVPRYKHRGDRKLNLSWSKPELCESIGRWGLPYLKRVDEAKFFCGTAIRRQWIERVGEAQRPWLSFAKRKEKTKRDKLLNPCGPERLYLG